MALFLFLAVLAILSAFGVIGFQTTHDFPMNLTNTNYTTHPDNTTNHRSCIGYPLKPTTALYIFGDSYVDAGNNKFMYTKAQANVVPYGIDHPLGITGRFTNGLTVADFFGQWLGLGFQPPALDLKRSPTYEGLNYASGSSGLLENTGSIAGKHLYFKDQINLFSKTVTEQLSVCFSDRAVLGEYLSKSIFYVNIGHNDYTLSYLNHNNNLSIIYNSEDFANLLIQELENNLKVLYNMGARKIIVAEVSPIGCTPSTFEDQYHPPNQCNESINALVKIYNSKLATHLQSLGSALKESTFVVAKQFGVILDMVENPTKYGLIDGRNPCVNENRIPCTDRDSYVFFDTIHPTEVVYKTLAMGCFNGSGVCIPINVEQLAKKMQ